MLNVKGLLNSWILPVIAIAMLVSLTWVRWGYSQMGNGSTESTTLQGVIQVHPVKPLPHANGDIKIQPGTPVKLSIEVENKGHEVSQPGKVYIRYGFGKPLENESRSIVFETEKATLPAIMPGEKVEIAFSKEHQWPSILDFVRDDWSMREYQGVVAINGLEKNIGILAITFSAYYYPGILKELPATVPAMNSTAVPVSK